MALGIPLPGMPGEALLNGLNTGSSMFTRIMQPILEREKQKQLEQHFQEQLKLSKAAAGRAAQSHADAHKMALMKMDPAYEAKQYEALENYFKSKGQNQGQQGASQVTSPSYVPGIGGSIGNAGLIAEGNIDLDNRPILKNPDGGYSTVSTATFGIDNSGNENGKTVLLPTIINGKRVSGKEAFDHFKKTGEHMGIFKTRAEADKYDEQLHQNKGWIGEKNKWPSLDQNPDNNNQPMQPQTSPQNTGGIDLDMLKAHPMLRGWAKKHLGYDPLAVAPQTPEEKQASALELFNQKENIKKQNKGGDVPTNTVLTQNQQALQGIDTVLPMLEELITNPSKVYGKYDFSPSKKAAYNAKTSGMIDTLVAAQSLPKVQASIDLVEQQIRRATNEGDDEYISRLKDLKKDLILRRSKAQSVLKNRKVNTEDLPDFSKMSDDELRKIAGGG